MLLLPGGWEADAMAAATAAILDQKGSEWMAEQQDRRSLGPFETETPSQ